MNKEQLFAAFSAVDDELLQRSEQKPPRRTGRWVAVGALAACVCLAVGLTLPHLLSRGAEPNAEASVPPASEQSGEVQTVTAASSASLFETLPQLLEYLGAHESHDASASVDGENTVSAAAEVETDGSLEHSATAVLLGDGTVCAYLSENGIVFSRLNGEDTAPVGQLGGNFSGLLADGNVLYALSCLWEGDELDGTPSVRLEAFDLTDPSRPERTARFVQRGELANCTLSGGQVTLVTRDGVCACGWSRTDDASEYYPSLTADGVEVSWTDEEISILGEPTAVRYHAFTVLEGANIVAKKALYGDISQLFCREDGIIAVIQSKTADRIDNPTACVVRLGTGELSAVSVGGLFGLPDTVARKNYVITEKEKTVSLASAELTGQTLRLIGTGKECILAASVNLSNEASETARLDAQTELYRGIHEIRWETERAIICVKTVEKTADQECDWDGSRVRFLFAAFDEGVKFYVNDLTADVISGSVGMSYGNPMGRIVTLIPLGSGLYVRYSHLEEGPGGFDLFDFSDSAAPKLLYRAETSLAGENAFDYVNCVTDGNTLGVLKIILGQEEYFRKVHLAWCVYRVDPEAEQPFTLLSEQPIGGEIATFFGAKNVITALQTPDGVYLAGYVLSQPVKVQ